MTKAWIPIKHRSKKKYGMCFETINKVGRGGKVLREWCKNKLKCKLGFDHREPEMKI